MSIQQPGWWQGADGTWHPPETPRPQPQGAGVGAFISFLGWAVVVCGLAVLIATLAEVQDQSDFNPSINLGDYLIALSPSFIVMGVGATAAGVGHAVTSLQRS